MLDVMAYTPAMDEKWDAFVSASLNGNLFNTRRFLAYHPAGRLQEASLAFFRKGKLVGLLPGILRGDAFVSHGGASYGGFVIERSADFDLCSEMVASGMEHLSELGVKEVRITFPPKFYWRDPHDYLEFALLKKGFRYLKREITNACGEIGPGYFDGFVNKARGAVRRARREGVLLETSQAPSDRSLAEFYTVLEANRSSLGADITHSMADLQRLFQLVPDHLELFLARVDGRAIGSGLVFRCNPRVDLIFYVAHLREEQAYKPVHLICDAIYSSAASRSVAWVDYGISTFGGDVLGDGDLIRFKENFNMRGYFRDTFEASLH